MAHTQPITIEAFKESVLHAVEAKTYVLINLEKRTHVGYTDNPQHKSKCLMIHHKQLSNEHWKIMYETYLKNYDDLNNTQEYYKYRKSEEGRNLYLPKTESPYNSYTLDEVLLARYKYQVPKIRSEIMQQYQLLMQTHRILEGQLTNLQRTIKSLDQI